jgi:hypothetical protein
VLVYWLILAAFFLGLGLLGVVWVLRQLRGRHPRRDGPTELRGQVSGWWSICRDFGDGVSAGFVDDGFLAA